ncbi:pantoate--beta-alanine ligase [Fusobacterium russii]|uniref:pantoate--beta-alanine ligase n=1 Tax=Fusobacterium russii TaxID=854 RepID=UPI000399C2AF|nr:pantoate--beta-alanine ligase [Fusobacterium russii]
MKVIEDLKELKQFVKEQKKLGKSIGLVPTMGYLHEGHQALMKKAREENDIVIVSDFVNPIQFGPNEDYDAYPRNLEHDIEKCSEQGVDILFVPSVEDMYSTNYATYVNVEGLTDNLCGAQRPGHFRGVCTVVLKLFNITKANRAYFGKKDIQQLMIIRRMVKDLDIDIEIVALPIIRETDGLAKSSRNKYLSDEQRKAALSLSKALELAQTMIDKGEKNTKVLREAMREIFKKLPCTIDYIKIVDGETLKDIENITGPSIIALAIKFGTTRLIDNRTVGF